MCVTATARRRRQQATSGYRHLPKRKRPNYSTSTAELSAARLHRVIENERTRQQRKRK